MHRPNDFHRIHERLDHLERRNRTLMRVLAAMAVVFCFIVAAGVNSQERRVIDTERINLRDQDGKLRAALGTMDSAVGFEVFDSNGKSRAAFSVLPEAVNFALTGHGGLHHAASVDVEADGSVSLELRYPDGTPAIELAVPAQGKPSVRVLDGSGRFLFSAPSSPASKVGSP